MINKLQLRAKQLLLPLRKNCSFIWNSDCQKAFDDLKNIFMKDIVVSLPDLSKIFFLYTDASYIGVGCILAQDYGNGPQPISFFSKNFSESQSKRRINENELAAFVFALMKP